MRGDRRLAAGTRLPSTRNLAAELMVSRRGEAYEQLSAEGWLLARRGAGTTVAATPPRPAAQHTPPDPPRGPLHGPGTGWRCCGCVPAWPVT
ncbi:GntR family transcriptional regulator [Micromonospora sp. LOL_015]|uniref:GntR family transcriptional regulator n=1 Tax=Micromonospora sp. LOL_015 TaxID=3345416 RepID=UPI003A8650E4